MKQNVKIRTTLKQNVKIRSTLKQNFKLRSTLKQNVKIRSHLKQNVKIGSFSYKKFKSSVLWIKMNCDNCWFVSVYLTRNCWWICWEMCQGHLQYRPECTTLCGWLIYSFSSVIKTFLQYFSIEDTHFINESFIKISRTCVKSQADPGLEL